MKNPEPTMLPITSAVQVTSPRLLVSASAAGAVVIASLTTSDPHSGSATTLKKNSALPSGSPK